MLRIPNLTLEDHFRLSDFQHDFSYIMEALKAASLNAKDFGITGIEEDDNTDKIQELIAMRGNIYFGEGIYTLTKMIDVYSDTTITLHPKAVFLRKHPSSMFQTATTEDTTDYNGERNIRFNGGTYKHDGDNDPSNIFSIFHAQDIAFNDVVCLNTVGAHCLDLVGSKDIKVRNCKFLGYKSVVIDPNKEAIQIDGAGCYSYPVYENKNAACYDGTPTCDVLIEGCYFGASDELPSFPTAIGQHGQHALKGSRYTNIKVINNIMEGDTSYTYSYGLRPISWEDSVIQGNTIKGYRIAIFADMYDKVVAPNGVTVKEAPDNCPTKNDEDTLFLGCRNIIISNNNIVSGISVATKPGIWFNIAGLVLTASKENSPKHRNITITGNSITMPSGNVKSYAIEFDTTEEVVINGNTLINNAKADSVGVYAVDYCANISIGSNNYKGITDANKHLSASNTTNIKRQGKNLLWEGTWFEGKMQQDGTNAAAGQIVTLSDATSNYDYLIFEFYNSGTNFANVDFSKNNTNTIRTMNLADSATSLTYSLSEFVFQRKSETTIELNVNKFMNMSTTPATVQMNSENQYIKSITGVNY